MPSFEWNSGTNRYDTDTLVDCALAPVNNDDLVNKLYCDTAVGGAAIFMSQYPTPQDAVVAAIASGVNAIFVDDVFTITAPVNLNSDGLAFLGLGMDTGFIVDDVTATGALTIPNANVVVTNLSIHVTNCAAAAEIITVAGTRSRLESIRMTFGAAVVAAAGVHLTGGTNHVLDRVTADCAGGATVTDGVVVDLGRVESQLHSVTVLSANTNGCEIAAERTKLEHSEIVSSGAANVYIASDGCEIVGGANRLAGTNGVSFEQGATNRRLRISGYLIDSPTLDGIQEVGGGAGDTFLVMTSSIISSVGQDGLGNIGDMQVSTCEIVNFARSAIRLPGRIFLANSFLYHETLANTGNIIVSDGATHRFVGNLIVGDNIGIEFTASPWFTIIDDNTFTTGSTSIQALAGANGAVTITKNSCFPTAGSSIVLNAIRRSLISGNYITCPDGVGIDVTGFWNVVSDNLLLKGGVGVSTHAIRLAVSAGGGLANQAKGNRITGNFGTGIEMGAVCDNAAVCGNEISGVGGDGIYLADCDYCAVSDNIIDTCGDNGIELDGNSARNKVGDNVTSNCAGVGIFLDDTCDFNLVGLNQVPDLVTMGAGVNNEHYHNMV